MIKGSQALIPFYIKSKYLSFTFEAIVFLAGISLLSLLAQISIPLPFTPVPITGQTFGVSLVALSWGRKRASSIFIAYLLIGALGCPVFAQGKSGLLFGPTVGYLVGMLFECYVVGFLSDVGFTKTLFKTLIASWIGSFFVFSCGLFVLSYFVPTSQLLYMGFFPFILGDLIKNILASVISWKARQVTVS